MIFKEPAFYNVVNEADVTFDLMDELKQFVNTEIENVFQSRTPESLYQPMRHLLEGGGKRIRPILLILSCQAVGGTTESCLSAAVAVELLHTFTLVHDDIMDHDDVRRGRPTVHTKWDEATAILAGDALVTLAYKTMLKTHHPELRSVLDLFSEALLVLCEGQALDKDFEVRESVSLHAYNDMIIKKTAKLMEVSCEIGVILGDGREEERQALRRFAGLLGQAFQIHDDLLDIISDQHILGKPLGSDLMEGKKTYLTIDFLHRADPEAKRRFKQLWGSGVLSQAEIKEIKEMFKKAGTLQATQDAVETLTSLAIEPLMLLDASPARDTLIDLVRRLRERMS